MTVTEPKVDEADASRPQPGRRSRAQLLETPDGWVLTLTVDARTAVQLRRELGRGRNSHRFAPDDVEVSIVPNLVPGSPFVLSAVEIVIA